MPALQKQTQALPAVDETKYLQLAGFLPASKAVMAIKRRPLVYVDRIERRPAQFRYIVLA
jgi:hypothetical protein